MRHIYGAFYLFNFLTAVEFFIALTRAGMRKAPLVSVTALRTKPKETGRLDEQFDAAARCFEKHGRGPSRCWRVNAQTRSETKGGR